MVVLAIMPCLCMDTQFHATEVFPCSLHTSQISHLLLCPFTLATSPVPGPSDQFWPLYSLTTPALVLGKWL